MSPSELPFLVFDQLEEFGLLLTRPLFFFFEQNYPIGVYLTAAVVIALIGLLTWAVIGKALLQLVLNSFSRRTSSHIQSKKPAILPPVALDALAIGLAVLSVYLLSTIGLLMAEVLTSQSLLALSLMVVRFPIAGLFFGLFAFVTVGVVAPIYWLGRVAARCFPERRAVIQTASIMIYVVTCLAALLGVITEASWDDGGGAAHHIHAMVKNTCIIDPQQVNCPHSVEELAQLEPSFFRQIQDTHQVFYSYDQQSNQYILLVRYSPRDALLFSQLLKSPDQNGNEANDFQLMEIETIGRDRVKDMPEFARQFEYLPEWDKR